MPDAVRGFVWKLLAAARAPGFRQPNVYRKLLLRDDLRPRPRDEPPSGGAKRVRDEGGRDAAGLATGVCAYWRSALGLVAVMATASTGDVSDGSVHSKFEFTGTDYGFRHACDHDANT